MNIKNRALLIVSLVILGLSGFLLHQGISYFNEEIEHSIHEQERFIDGISSDIQKHSFDAYLFRINHFIQHNTEIGEALADPRLWCLNLAWLLLGGTYLMLSVHVVSFTRDLGVNLAGVEIILNMRRKMEQIQKETGEFVEYVKQELLRGNREGWQQRIEQALVRLPPRPLAPVKHRRRALCRHAPSGTRTRSRCSTISISSGKARTRRGRSTRPRASS